MKQLSKILAALLAKLLLISLLFGCETGHAQSKSTSVRIEKNGKTSISVSNPFGKNFHVEYEGDIVLSDDDTDVVSISSGGYMEIRRSAFGSRRRIFIEPDNTGKLIKKYYVGSSRKSFEGEGQKWLAEVLLDVVRTTTLGSQQRVDRIYKKRGAYGVLREVNIIDSDYVKSRYIKLLLKKNLNNPDIIAVLEVVGNDVDSDYHKADILKNNSEELLSTEGSISAFINAASNIDSDHHKAEVLKKSLREGKINENQMQSMFVIARGIDSDYHKSKVLLTALGSNSLSTNNAKLLATAAKTINSDHHRAEVLKSAIAKSGLSTSTEHTFLDAIDGMSSDYHVADVLSEMVNSKDLEPSTISHILKKVSSMDSDSHQASVLKKMMQRQSFSGNNIEDLVATLGRINSDSHTAAVLKQVTKLNLKEKQMIEVFSAVRRINSDHHKAEVLVKFATKASQSGPDVVEAYRSACSSINSNSHYRRALNAIQ